MSTKCFFLSVLASLLLGLMAQAAEIRGIILKADADKHQLTIEGRGLGVRGAILTFQLDKDTPIQAGRKPASVTDLTPGRRVRVAYDLQGDRRVALLVTLLGAPPSSTPPAEAAPNSGNTVSGILRRVSFTEREIVVISPASKGGPEVETILSVPETAKITKDQKAIPFDDLKEGEQVFVQAEKRDRKLVAKSIQLGVTANANTNPEPAENKIEKIRGALKMLDFFLRMMEQKQH
jgi:hypothetical protein